VDEHYKELLNLAEQLVNRISFDENGQLVGGRWVGGNGGLISRETTVVSDALRRVINRIKSGQER
jgi:hypothetical protein